MIKLAQKTPNRKILNILDSVLHDLLSVSCKMLLIKLFINGKIQILLLDEIISYSATKLNNVVDFMCQLGSYIFAGPITFIIV